MTTSAEDAIRRRHSGLVDAETSSDELSPLNEIFQLIQEYPQANSNRKNAIVNAVIERWSADSRLLCPTIELIGEAINAQLNVGILLEKLGQSHRTEKIIVEHRIVATTQVFIVLARFISTGKLVLDAKPNAKPNIIQAFLRVPSLINSERGQEETEVVLANVATHTLILLNNFLEAYQAIDQEKEVSKKNVELLALLTAWKIEASRQDVMGNLLHILHILRFRSTDSEGKKLADAIFFVIPKLEAINGLSRSREIREREAAVESATRLEMKSGKNEFFDEMHRIHSNFVKLLQPDGNVGGFELFISEDESLPSKMALSFLIGHFIRESKRTATAHAHLQFPEGSEGVIVTRNPAQRKQAIENFIRTHFESRFISKGKREAPSMSKELREPFLLGMVPEVYPTTEELEDAREFAASGFIALSSRGNSVSLVKRKEETEAYLRDLGIQRFIFRQTEKGISCKIIWLQMEISFLIDHKYHLIECDDLDESVKMWLEYALLKLIGDIKREKEIAENLNETDGDKKEKKKLYGGRSAHLRVLHPSQVTQHIDLNDPELAGEDEISIKMRTHELVMLDSFFVSLYTLNVVFYYVQDHSEMLEPEHQEELIAFIENEDRKLPEWRRMKTSAQSVVSMMEKAMERRNKKSHDEIFDLEKNVIYTTITSVTGVDPDDELKNVPLELQSAEAIQAIAKLGQRAA